MGCSSLTLRQKRIYSTYQPRGFEILALLAERRQLEVSQALQGLLLEPRLNDELRADVLAVLAADPQWLEKSWDEQLKQRLSQLAVSSHAWETELERIDRWQSGFRTDQPRPPAEDFESWYQLVGQGGDERRGWRVWGYARSAFDAMHCMDVGRPWVPSFPPWHALPSGSR